MRHHEIREEKLLADYFDCIPDNLVADEHNILHFIDREWHWEGPVPRLWVLVRGLRAFWAAYQPWLERLAWPGSRDSLQFLDECLAFLEIPATAADIKNCLEGEDRFQQLVIWGKEGLPPIPSAGSFMEDLLQGAREALDRQDWPAAVGILGELTSRFPDLTEAYLLLSDILTIQGKHQEAMQVLSAARQNDPESLPLLKRLGLNSRQRGDLSSALAAFTRAWQQAPRDPELLAHVSSTCLDLGLPAEARQYYLEALKGDPKNIELWLGLAQLARHTDDRATFEEACRQAEALDPNHPRLLELTSGRVQAEKAAGPSLPVQDQGVQLAEAKRVPASIIIPVFNNLELTQNCLESIWQYTPPDLYELIVVDNASRDGTPAFLAAMAAAGKIRHIANNTNLGYAKGCNQGARIARGDYLVMLNNDTLVTSGWLNALIEAVEKDDHLAIVGAKLLYPDDSVQHAGVVFNQNCKVYHLYRYLHRDHPAVNKRREFQVVTAACLLIRTAVFFQVGLFDENFRNGFEDVDLCLQVKQLGYPLLYNPECVVYHLESKTAGRHDHELKNSRYLSEKWQGRIVPDDFRYYEEDGLRLEWITNSQGEREAVIPRRKRQPL